MKKLSNTEVELKKSVIYKKVCICYEKSYFQDIENILAKKGSCDFFFLYFCYYMIKVFTFSSKFSISFVKVYFIGMYLINCSSFLDYKNSPSKSLQVLYGINIQKNLAKFTEKHMRWSKKVLHLIGVSHISIFVLSALYWRK